MDSTQKSPAPRAHSRQSTAPSAVLRDAQPSPEAVEPQANPSAGETRLLSEAELRPDYLPCSRATFWRLVKSGDFPKPIKVGRRSFWLRREVLAWIEERAAARTAA